MVEMNKTDINLRLLLIHTLVTLLPIAIITGIIAFFFLTEELKINRIALESDENKFVSLQKQEIINELDHIVTHLMLLPSDFDLHKETSYNNVDPMELLNRELLTFSENVKSYDQIRLLDESGMEPIRVNLGDGKPYLAAKSELQFKGHRYYFKEAIKFGRGEVYVSPFDLNIEHGQIERPLKPVIRFATPVFFGDGKKRGIVIVNYLGQNLLSSIKELANIFIGKFIFSNTGGYWLVRSTLEEEWALCLNRQPYKVRM